MRGRRATLSKIVLLSQSLILLRLSSLGDYSSAKIVPYEKVSFGINNSGSRVLTLHGSAALYRVGHIQNING